MTLKNFDKNMYKKNIGTYGENLASYFLQKYAYKILAINWRPTNKNSGFLRGELDIIASKNNKLIIVEVKTRTSINYGTPTEAVNKKKYIQLKKLALCYYRENHNIISKLHITEICIDVIGILIQKNHKPQITHIKNVYF
jgi:putative endonuclease